jgi:hypothetical protein
MAPEIRSWKSWDRKPEAKLGLPSVTSSTGRRRTCSGPG